ncbi:MAG: hypothetical protein RXQ94_06675 [Caldivirga sp.]
MSDNHLASIEGTMRTMKRLCMISIALACSSLALSIVAILPMWVVMIFNIVMIPIAVALLASLFLWLFINLGIARISYGITEINVNMVLGIIKDMDPNRLIRFVNEFSNFLTRFRMRSFLALLIMFWGFFNVIFCKIVLSFGSISLGLFATALAFAVPVSVSIIIALGSHYSELVREDYVHPKDPQQLLNLIKSASFTWDLLFVTLIIPMVVILLSLPLILPVTITRSTLMLIVGFSLYFALALSELIVAMQWLMLVLMGRNISQFLSMVSQLKAQGGGNKQ